MKQIKSIRLLLLLAIILFCFNACGDNESDSDENNPTENNNGKTELVLSSDSELLFKNGINFTFDKGEQIISFSCNKDWNIIIANPINGDTWCSASSISGKAGNHTVKINVTENNDYNDRSVSLTLKVGNIEKNILVTQKQKDAILLTSNRFDIDKTGGKINVEVKSNIDYTIEIQETAKSWIKQTNTKALITNSLSFEIAPSEEANKREGEIYFISGDIKETVKVYQTGEEILLLTKNDYSVSSDGETITVEIKSNFNYKVKMPSVSWIKNAPSTKAVSSHTLYYVIEPNNTYENRQAEIIYYSEKTKSIADTLKVIQKAKKTITVTGVSLDKNNITLAIDETITLAATVTPTNATNKNVIWNSNNPSIAKVDINGKITALTKGEATISVKTEDGEKIATCKIIVIADENDEDITAHFDSEFARYLFLNNYIPNPDKIMRSDVNKITGLYITPYKLGSEWYLYLRSVAGLEYFEALTTLKCDNNPQLSALDISKNTQLTYLSCENSSIGSLDVSKHTALTELRCNGCKLSNLDISKNTKLTYLDCGSNGLTSLDISKNTALTTLHCGYNQITNLDVSGHTALKVLHCTSNKLTSLDVSKNTALTSFTCGYNQITSLNVNKNTELTNLQFQGNRLTGIDVSKNTHLTTLWSHENQLTNLDVSKNTALSWLYCMKNQLRSLDISKNAHLTTLWCHDNPGDEIKFIFKIWFSIKHPFPATRYWDWNGNRISIEYQEIN